MTLSQTSAPVIEQKVTARFLVDAARRALATHALSVGTTDSGKSIIKHRPIIEVRLDIEGADFRPAVERLTDAGCVNGHPSDHPGNQWGLWVITDQISRTVSTDPYRVGIMGVGSRAPTTLDLALDVIDNLTKSAEKVEGAVWMHVMPSDLHPVLEALRETTGLPSGPSRLLEYCFTAEVNKPFTGNRIDVE